jgi:hypothetical protein
MHGISLMAGQLLVSEEGFFSMELLSSDMVFVTLKNVNI